MHANVSLPSSREAVPSAGVDVRPGVATDRLGRLRRSLPPLPPGVRQRRPAAGVIEEALGGERPCHLEWAATAAGLPVWTLALVTAAKTARRRGGPVLLVDDGRSGLGIAELVEPGRLVVVRPLDERRAWWAVEQGLRCPAVGAVVAATADLPRAVQQRWRHAGRHAGTPLHAVRTGGRQASRWSAQVRLLVRDGPPGESPRMPVDDAGGTRRRVWVEAIRTTDAPDGAGRWVEIDGATGVVCMGGALAAATATGDASAA